MQVIVKDHVLFKSGYTEEIKRFQDVYDTWIIENFSYRIVPEHHYTMLDGSWVYFSYEFECEEDAMAFKLRWID